MNSHKKQLRESYPYAWRWISVSKRIAGWLTDGEANALFEIACTRTPDRAATVVELGSWQGKSSVLLAAGLLGKPGSRLFCVDPFGEDENPELQAKHYDPLIGKMRLSLEENFRRNIRRCGVSGIVHAIKGYSFEAVRSWKQPIDMLFIDASHGYESVYRDFALWSPFVKTGGIIALHDAAGVWPGPTRVVQEEMQPPQFDDLHQVDSLAWSIKQHGPSEAVLSAPEMAPEAASRPGSELASKDERCGSPSEPTGQQSGKKREEVTARLIGALDRSAGQVTALKAEVGRLTGELTAQAEAIGQLKAEVASRNGEAVSLDARLQALTAALAEQSERRSSSEIEVRRLTARLAEEAEERSRLATEIQRLTATVAEQTQQRSRSETEVQRLTAALADETGQLRNLEAELAFHKAQLDRKKTQFLSLVGELASRDGRISAAERQAAEKSRRAQTTEFSLKVVSLELQESRHAVQALKRSWSWRITAPLRAVVDFGLTIQRLARGSGRDRSARSKALGWIQWLYYRDMVRSSGLFDEHYYLSHNPDVAQSGIDALRHFFIFGAGEARNPHPLFDLRFYFGRNADIAGSSINPLLHYLKWGAKENRDPHPDFDTSFYRESNPDVDEAGLNPLAHFMGVGVAQGLDPNPWFDTSEYLESNSDVALKGLNPLVHHLENREANRRRKLNREEVAPETRSDRPVLPPGMGINPLTTQLRSTLREEWNQSPKPSLDSEYNSLPLVTVVIPCYNYGYYLEDAILSAMMACTYPLEILVIDDGSTDPKSVAIVEELAARYRFRLLRQANTGQGGARLNGIRNSRGKFIQFLDADDLLAPEKIDFQLDMMTQDGGIDIAVCEYELCDSDGGGRRRMEPSTLAGFAFKSEDFLLRWERGFSLPIHCALFRRSVLHDDQFQLVTKAGKEDWIFWIVLAAQSPRFQYHSDVLATYRIHGHNTYVNREGMGLDFLRASMYVLRAGLTDGCDNFLEESIGHFRNAYLGSIKNEAIVWSKTHSGE